MTDRDRFAVKICNATQKTNFACKDAKCVGKGLCAYCYTMADDILANGVIVPPCKVGDYVRVKGLTSFWRVDAIHYYREGLPQITITYGKISNTLAFSDSELFEVFTKEEAEEKLKELGK